MTEITPQIRVIFERGLRHIFVPKNCCSDWAGCCDLWSKTDSLDGRGLGLGGDYLDGHGLAGRGLDAVFFWVAVHWHWLKTDLAWSCYGLAIII